MSGIDNKTKLSAWMLTQPILSPPQFSGFMLGIRLGDANDGRRQGALRRMWKSRRYQNMSRSTKTKLRRLLLNERVAH